MTVNFFAPLITVGSGNSSTGRGAIIGGISSKINKFRFQLVCIPETFFLAFREGNENSASVTTDLGKYLMLRVFISAKANRNFSSFSRKNERCSCLIFFSRTPVEGTPRGATPLGQVADHAVTSSYYGRRLFIFTIITGQGMLSSSFIVRQLYTCYQRGSFSSLSVCLFKTLKSAKCHCSVTK